MTRRTLAALVALPLLAILWLAALFLPVPYVTYTPGLTVDVLAEEGGKEIVQVTGHKTYRDDGELRMTTVYVTEPDAQVNIFEALTAWVRTDEAVYPHDAVYPEGETAEESEAESAVQMVSSQDSAVAVALDALGYDVKPVIEILNVDKGSPADGKLKVRDVVLEVNHEKATDTQRIVDIVRATKPGEAVDFTVRRDGERLSIPVTPEKIDGHQRVGVIPGPGYIFPFQVKVGIPDTIGGPSAGLMFSLGIYDTLTPGSLTGGQIVAGTGTIAPDGKVGPIGGIQQKVVAAHESGAELFLVPADNCADALNAPEEPDLRLVKATTFKDAKSSIEAWVKDPGAKLPSCEED